MGSPARSTAVGSAGIRPADEDERTPPLERLKARLDALGEGRRGLSFVLEGGIPGHEHLDQGRAHLLGRAPRAVWRVDTPEAAVEVWPLGELDLEADARRRGDPAPSIEVRDIVTLAASLLADAPVTNRTTGESS